MKGGRPLGAFDCVAASVVSKGIAVSISNPMLLLRTRLMEEQSEYHGTWHATKTIFAEEGIAAFYRGTSAALWKVVTAGISLPVYDFLVNRTKHLFS